MGLEKKQALTKIYSKARAEKIVKDFAESKIRQSHKEINNCNNLKDTLVLLWNIIFNNYFQNSPYTKALSCKPSGADENQ